MEPVKPDEMWCVWWSPQTGTFEWICGAKAANDLFHGGMTKINDQPVIHLQIVDVWPELKGVHVRATTSTGERIDVAK